MINIKINGILSKVDTNSTVLEACSTVGIQISKFCYNEHLRIAGNCRMCLVEIKNSPKPVASCAMPVMENMEIYTDTPLVKKAREAVIEFLLINHPLDCPICDQGGECDLQDQTLNFGSDRSRFFDLKRTVEDKNCGPFIKTIMTRCIHCTRCVRFSHEFTNIDNLGTVGRGNKTEISFYLNNIFNSELSGNVIDLCPVGALTSKPFAFKARSWELKKKHSIDIFDSINSKIVIQVYNNNIVRVLPRKNNNISNEWISNKTRFFFDSLKYQRLDDVFYKVSDNLKNINWETALHILNNKIIKTDPSQIKVFIGNLIDLKSLVTLKKNLNLLGINDIEYTGIKFQNKNYNNDLIGNYMFNKKIKDILNSDLCLLINCNPRLESSIFNLNLNNSNQKNNLEIISIGNNQNLNYDHKNIGLSLKNLLLILEGKHSLCKKILKSKNLSIILGSSLYNNDKVDNLILYLQNKFKKNINILQSESNFMNYLEIFKNKKINNNLNKLCIMFNTDEALKNLSTDTYRIYIGHHLTKDAQNSNLLLPCSSFFEQNNMYLNNMGLINKTYKVLKKKSKVNDSFSLFIQIYFFLNKNNKLKYKLKKNFNIYSYFFNKKLYSIHILYKYSRIHTNNKFYISPLKTKISNFYLTNIFDQHSKILMKNLQNSKQNNNFIHVL